jgi:CheY-like chemotaxis protein
VTEPRIRVLAVDDQRVVREGLAMLLGLLPDVEVVGTAADGEEALALAGELRPDVILMDLCMPRVDGVEATRRLRASHPEIKVVVLTTYADDRSVIDALRAGALGYLTKGRRRRRDPAGPAARRERPGVRGPGRADAPGRSDRHHRHSHHHHRRHFCLACLTAS